MSTPNPIPYYATDDEVVAQWACKADGCIVSLRTPNKIAQGKKRYKIEFATERYRAEFFQANNLALITSTD